MKKIYITTGVNHYSFDDENDEVITFVENKRTYIVSLIKTTGVPPQVIFDILHPAHESAKNSIYVEASTVLWNGPYKTDFWLGSLEPEIQKKVLEAMAKCDAH